MDKLHQSCNFENELHMCMMCIVWYIFLETVVETVGLSPLKHVKHNDNSHSFDFCICVMFIVVLFRQTVSQSETADHRRN